MGTVSTASNRDMAANYTALAALVGRLLISPIFITSGIGKITNSESYLGYIAASGLPFPVIALVGAIVLEIGGGAAIALGYQTRFVGLILALFSLLTALVFHSDFSDQNQFLHFWKNAAMAGGLLQLAAFGAGVASLDGRRSRQRWMVS
ncbi:DoxX family protein [Pararhizobium qamdonense]|uniref:DoxX family protein n=1 Tax=Pararhizobium qamdonense TaxID=3031126 RepID=UPI0023E220EB|nr:DoxX family protein [Pararhizobium qamdonense]